jgi:hypothetical protein
VKVPEFGQAVRDARVMGDEALWRSCYQRANGYYYTEKRVVREGDKERVEITTKHCKADLRAFMIWFHNRTQWLARTGALADETPIPAPSFEDLKLDEPPFDIGMTDGLSPDLALTGEQVVSQQHVCGEADATPSQQEDASEGQLEIRPVEEGGGGRLPIHNDLSRPDVGGSSVVQSRPELPGKPGPSAVTAWCREDRA